MNDLYVRRHVVLPRELLEAVWTRVHLYVPFVRRHVVPAEVANMGVDAQAHLAPVYVVALFGTKIPDAALAVVYRVLGRPTAALQLHPRGVVRRVGRRGIGVIVVIVETTPEHVH